MVNLKLRNKNVKSELINMTEAWDNEKIFVTGIEPMTSWTLGGHYTLSYEDSLTESKAQKYGFWTVFPCPK